jgi:hypothetical protein
MAQLGARITKLEATRPNPWRGICMEFLPPETRAAMAKAFGDFLACEAPDTQTYFQALLVRMNAARDTGQGMTALASADLAAVIAAYDQMAA